MTLIYKILSRAEWQAAQAAGRFDGSAVDLADGFIHLSGADHAQETAAKWFAGQADLVLLGVEAEALGPALKWEASRGGALFPHLYAPLDISAAVEVTALPLGKDGVPVLPTELLVRARQGMIDVAAGKYGTGVPPEARHWSTRTPPEKGMRRFCASLRRKRLPSTFRRQRCASA